jgi:hypothetical protein
MKYAAVLLTCLSFAALAGAQSNKQSLLPAKPASTPVAPANWQSGLRAKLLDGVKSIPKAGAPGPVAIFGQFAFPVIAANADGKSELALAAAAGYGKGRALIFGHPG